MSWIRSSRPEIGFERLSNAWVAEFAVPRGSFEHLPGALQARTYQ